MPYVRTVKTKSGATAVQIVYSSRRGSCEIEHLGSAHDEAELAEPNSPKPARYLTVRLSVLMSGYRRDRSQ